MPKVTDEYLALQRLRILRAAQRCFADRGFHATNMETIIAAAGVSANAVYRHFASKDALIAASCEDIFSSMIASVEQKFTTEQSGSFGGVLANLMEHRLKGEGDGLDGVRPVPLAINAWAEMPHNEVLRVTAGGEHEQLRTVLGRIVWAGRASGMVSSVYSDDVLARRVWLLLLGFLAQQNIVDDVSYTQLATDLDALVG